MGFLAAGFDGLSRDLNLSQNLDYNNLLSILSAKGMYLRMNEFISILKTGFTGKKAETTVRLQFQDRQAIPGRFLIYRPRPRIHEVPESSTSCQDDQSSWSPALQPPYPRGAKRQVLFK